MTVNLSYMMVVAVLYSCGIYLLLERSLTRLLLGVLLISNATNMLILAAGGAAGGAPLVGRTPNELMSDPLPQAMILTAIVITLGVAAFVLALIHRSWSLNAREDVQNDPEDVRIATEQGRIDQEAHLPAGEFPYDIGDDTGRRRRDEAQRVAAASGVTVDPNDEYVPEFTQDHEPGGHR
jgi:multicomponent Na+:H+ antiporter subunit C